MFRYLPECNLNLVTIRQIPFSHHNSRNRNSITTNNGSFKIIFRLIIHHNVDSTTTLYRFSQILNITMTAIVNPNHVKYFPEILPEAISITASTGGTNIASYSAFSPFIAVMNSLFTDVGEDVVLRVDQDSSYGTLESEGTGRSDREEVKLEIPCVSSLDLWAVGAATEIAYTAYTLKITQPTVFDKLKYGYSLSSEEQALAEMFDIQNKFKAGLLNQIGTPMFQKIYEVVKLVTVAAGGNTRVGSLINVKSGQKAVLLSIGTNSVFGGLTANDTYITINRDISDKSYVKLDTFAMPGLNHDINCYIPGINRLEVLLESTTGVTSMPVRYKYGISNITILEKIKWGIGLSSSEIAIATELDLYNLVSMGVM